MVISFGETIMSKNIEINYKNDSSIYETLYPKSLATNITMPDSNITIDQAIENHRTDDTFEVGDIICTTRPNMSEKWLECDGESVDVDSLEGVIESTPLSRYENKGIVNSGVISSLRPYNFWRLSNNSLVSGRYLFDLTDENMWENYKQIDLGGYGFTWAYYDNVREKYYFLSKHNSNLTIRTFDKSLNFISYDDGESADEISGYSNCVNNNYFYFVARNGDYIEIFQIDLENDVIKLIKSIRDSDYLNDMYIFYQNDYFYLFGNENTGYLKIKDLASVNSLNNFIKLNEYTKNKQIVLYLNNYFINSQGECFLNLDDFLGEPVKHIYYEQNLTSGKYIDYYDNIIASYQINLGDSIRVRKIDTENNGYDVVLYNYPQDVSGEGGIFIQRINNKDVMTRLFKNLNTEEYYEYKFYSGYILPNLTSQSTNDTKEKYYIKTTL